MKPVTKERILNALERINKARNSRDRLSEVIRASCLYGMRSLIKGTYQDSLTPNTEKQRLALEFDFAGQQKPQSNQDIDSILDQWTSFINHYHQWSTKVYEIQRKHGISGVEITPKKVMGRYVDLPNIFDGELSFIPSDLHVLRHYRDEPVNLFIELAKENGFTTVKKLVTPDDKAQTVSIDEIPLVAKGFDWSHISDYCGLELYLGRGLNTIETLDGNTSYWIER